MEKRGRVEHTVRNILWTYVSALVGSIFPFVIRTSILHYLGMEYLGLNSIYTAILQVLNVSELGIGQAIGISMYKPAAEENTKEVNKLISLYARFYRLLGIGIGIVGVILIPFIPQILNGEYPKDVNVFLAYFIYLLQSVLGYFVFPYCSTVFVAKQSVEKIYKYQSLIGIIIYSIQIFVICVYKDYYLYLLMLLAGTLLSGLANWVGMKKNYPQYRARKIKKEEFDKEFWNSLFKRVFAMALSKLRIVYRSSIDTIIISAFIGVIAVAKYQNYILTMAVPLMFISSVVTGILPSLGNSVALETKESNLAVIRLVTFILHWIGTVFSAFLMCFYQPFMKVWAGTEGLLSEKAVVLFVVYFYLRVISEISILIRNSSGVWWEGKWIAIVESLVNLLLNVALVHVWGVEGIIIATIVSLFFINIPFETYSVYKHYFEIKPWQELKEYMLQGCITLMVVTITYSVVLFSHSRGLNNGFVDILLCAFVPNLVLFTAHFKNEKMKRVIEIVVQGVIRKKNKV